ncbi:3862_t:CDS:2 [Ambispora leptoticha]|uniref:3862_t:CDS:1 n=1 Tax=Ambispora leptoticha TaxID=144679 RepID=A0A9N9AVX1_9GLOM|nr:3862_t:CDS:2 [Ambispora leptoticha]
MSQITNILKREWTPSDHILSVHCLSRRIASQKYLELRHIKYPDLSVPLIYRPRDGCKQNYLISIPGSSEKQELVKNNIVYLPLNTLPEKFIKDILSEEKIIDWDLGYAMTVHTSQRMTLEALQRVWIIDEYLVWDNLIYLTVGRVEYLNQLVRIEGPPLPPEIEEAKNKKAIERSLNSQKNTCELFLNEMLWEWNEAGNPGQWSVDATLKGMYVLSVLNAIGIIESDSHNEIGTLAIM